MGIIITFILGIFLLSGVLVIRMAKNSEKVEQLSIAIALGTMTSLMGIELIPEVLETFKGKNLIAAIAAVAIGILLLKLLDHFIPDHEDLDLTEETHENKPENVIHIGIISAVAIIIHNIVEGMAVYSLAEESLKVGILVGLGVGLHNIPMGMLMYSTLEKDTKAKRIVILAAAAVSTLAGGIMMALISQVLSEFVIGILICLALGMLIYIVVFELIPHLIHCKRWSLSAIGIVIGIVIIVISSLLE